VSHGLVGELVEDWRIQIHRSIDNVQHSSWSGSCWGKVFVEFRIQVQLVLDKASQVGA
jgi:hypothetical protein